MLQERKCQHGKLPALLNRQDYPYRCGFYRQRGMGGVTLYACGVSNLPIRAKLRDYKSRCTCRISFFHAGDRTQMTTKEGRRLKET
jgi:hypothetical protein